jgi:superfamily II DNA helicase RecQ
MRQYRSFKLSVMGDGIEELNLFLQTINLLSEERNFVENSDASFWAVLICYELKESTNSYDAKSSKRKKQKNYEDILTTTQYACFCELREWRNSTAKEQGLPAYAIFTNDMAEAMVKIAIPTKTALANIEGFGEAKQEKYTTGILSILSRHSQNE